MKRNRFLWIALVFSLLSLSFSGCGSSEKTITFSQLISQAEKYNGNTVTFEAFYFSGFEISALSGSLGPSNDGIWRIIPSQPLIWVKGGISQEFHNKLSKQTTTPSGYAERFGKLKVTGTFETGGQYGHLDAYEYQIDITSVELLEWSPPPA